MEITLSENLSYCFGVKRTLTLVEELLTNRSDKVYYMLGEIVHNEHVINNLKSKGLKIIYNLDQVEDNGVVIIQSHGAPRITYKSLESKKIHYIDATCPMVQLIHKKIIALEEEGFFPVIIGKEGHDEVKGISGQVQKSLIIGKVEQVKKDLFSGITKAGVVVQSTFIRQDAMDILDRIKTLVPDVKFINTICRPTIRRQIEIQEVSGLYDCILIVGSKTSANTNHLFRLAKKENRCVYLVDDPESIENLAISDDASVFIASGASTPLSLIGRAISQLIQKRGPSRSDLPV